MSLRLSPALRRALEQLRRRPELEEEAGLLLSFLSSTRVSDGRVQGATTHAREPRRVEDFTRLGLLGRGATGEVWRVLDEPLQRPVALKLLYADDPDARRRFLKEARITASLQHPGVAPVHRLGTSDDGRPFFTMKEVSGRTLKQVIQQAHEEAKAHPERGPQLRNELVGAFQRVCEAMAYAHSRGVVHLDLKPSNIMLGAWGEVQVLDWGLAQRLPDDHPVQLNGVSGTPRYLSPEQAESKPLDRRSDVYSLGAVLFQLLAGEPPVTGPTAELILVRTALGERRALAGPWPIPAALAELCERALALKPADRPADAGVLVQELSAWLSGSEQRARGLALVREAEGLRPEVARLREQAGQLRRQAAARLAELAPWEEVEHKREAWDLEDRAEQSEQEAQALDLKVGERLSAALTQDPGLVEAHALLAERALRAHAEAEAQDEAVPALAAEGRLRQHLEALPEEHPLRARASGWLRGIGALSLVTDPPGASVMLYRYRLQDRRLVAVPERHLGRTPLRQVPLRMGSYLVQLKGPGCATVHYPVWIGRQRHWDGVPPGSAAPLPIRLPREGDLGPHECYVPAGWFWAGGDEEVTTGMERRWVWCDGLVARRFPVTRGEWRLFAEDLAARDRSAEATAAYALLHGEGDDALPIVGLDWWEARAFARWTAERSGLPWRLPAELEWEKLARGVDRRFHPWGHYFDASWCATREHAPHRGGLRPVDSCPADEGPYGVRGAGGNVADWCADLIGRNQPPVLQEARGGARVVLASGNQPGANRPIRGGHWSGSWRRTRVCARANLPPDARRPFVGLRLVRSVR